MIPYLNINSLCISCDNCRLICPENAVLKDGKQFVIDSWKCTLCHACIQVCPVDCIKIIGEIDSDKY